MSTFFLYESESLINPLLPERNAFETDSFNTSVDSQSENDVISFWEKIQSLMSSVLREHEPVESSTSNDVLISHIYLQDYENSRPCSLSSSLANITEKQLNAHSIRYSKLWQYVLNGAVFLLFIASSMERTSNRSHIALIHVLTTIVIITDISMRSCHEDCKNDINDNSAEQAQIRRTRSHWWKLPTIIMLCGIITETFAKLIFTQEMLLLTSIFKPIIFFYVSTKARDALSALYHVSKIVLKVIMIELFVLLTFAAMACHLYFDFDAFRDLPTSFLSLFEMQTTAATPGLWIAVYNQYPSSAVFFVSFLVICVFYVHSIVLSVVFQTYIQAMTAIRQRSTLDRQESLKLAFHALHPRNDTETSETYVEIAKLKRVIQMIRPHYDDSKVGVLLRILDPTTIGKISFHSFRERMPKVLRTSLRTSRRITGGSIFLATLGVFVAISNLVYVLLLSSALEFLLLSNLILPVGSFIVFLALLEVILRVRPNSSSTNRHRVLDSLAIAAAFVSLTGLIMHAINDKKGLQLLLFGRAVDMLRVIRLSRIFRFIIKRSGEVLPAIVGPLALVLSSLHFFTYIGIFLWGGAVIVGGNEGRVTPLYDLNNFNSYVSGLLTMFNIFVVNDWQTIAEVYLVADRCSSPYIVYTFFIGSNLLGVCILLNVLTAFFVGAFVTKVEKRQEGNSGSSLRLEIPSSNLHGSGYTESTGDGEATFHIVERHGFDSVMNTITGDDDSLGASKKAFELFESYSNLIPEEKQVGFLVSCTQSQHYFANTQFQAAVRGIMNEEALFSIIDEMFKDLISCEDTPVRRELSRCNDDRMIKFSGSFCMRSPNVILIVAEVSTTDDRRS